MQEIIWNHHAEQNTRILFATIWPSPGQDEVAARRVFEEKILLFGSLETLAHILPVDDIPYRLNIVRPHIFVLKVVGVLPYINTKEGDETWAPDKENYPDTCFKSYI